MLNYTEEEKAKYIENTEKTLNNDLDKVIKKIKKISNWYSMSNYKLNTEDINQINTYIEKINEVYNQMKIFTFSAKQFDLYYKLNEMIVKKDDDTKNL